MFHYSPPMVLNHHTKWLNPSLMSLLWLIQASMKTNKCKLKQLFIKIWAYDKDFKFSSMEHKSLNLKKKNQFALSMGVDKKDNSRGFFNAAASIFSKHQLESTAAVVLAYLLLRISSCHAYINLTQVKESMNSQTSCFLFS